MTDDTIQEIEETPKDATVAKTGPKKRMTQAVKDRCKHLRNNGLHNKAIAATVGLDVKLVEKALS